MSILVNIENYESFYLDYLEGNLDEEQMRSFLLFLDQHPELKLEDELPSFAENDAVHLDAGFISGLKVFDAGELITDNNYGKFMIASVEQQLPATKQVELNDFIGRREHLKAEMDLYQRTRLIPDTLVYPHKSGLKRGLVIPMYVRLTAAAASIVLILMFVPWNSSPQSILSANLASLSIDVHPKAGSQQGTVTSPAEKTQLAHGTQTRVYRKNTLEAVIAQENNAVADLQLKQVRGFDNDTEKELVALKFKKVEPVEENPEKNNFYVTLDEMKNPVSFLTKGIKNKFNQDVDLRVAKASKTRQGGFYLKIGKFEFSRKTAPVDESLASN